MKTVCMALKTLGGAAITVAALLPMIAQAASTTTVSLGIDYSSGDYGTPDTTDTVTIPVSLKHENGPWTFRASLPYVRTEGTFNRDQGIDDSGRVDDNGQVIGKRTETGVGDLTLGAFYTLIDNPAGYNVELGGKAKLATADKDKTLITSGKNDYSVQVDVFRALPNVAIFATLGYTVKGEPNGVSYKNPFYTSLGLSVPLASGHSVGAAWDYRQKVTSGGDPVNELSAFYSVKLKPSNKVQFYLVKGLSDGSPEFGGGAVYSHSY